MFNVYSFRASAIILHAGNWPGGPLIYTFVIAGILCRVKSVILVLHNAPEPRLKFKYSLLEIIINNSNVKLVTVSEFTRKQIIKNSLFRKVSVIYNGFKFSTFNPVNNFKDNSIIRLGFVGFISHRKGVDLLLNALKKLNFSYELHLFGNADIRYLNTLLLNADKNIIYHGYCDNLIDIYEKFDILILPSRYDESFGMVVLEAMSFSKPVICSDAGGMQEIVVPGKTGYIFKSESALDLANCISKFYESSSNVSIFGANGYLHLINNFSLNRMISSYYSLINNHDI
jgi:glycosyltransferase involved in cell wall biosynthesis